MHGGQCDMLQHGFFERRCRATVQLRHRGEQSGAYEAKVDRYACIGKPSRISYRLYPRRSKRELDLSLSIF